MNLVKNPSKLVVIVSGLAALGLTSSNATAATIRVPAEQPTIQAGLDAATGGDTVLVSNGVYTGDGNRDLDFGGNNIVLISENGPDVTIIACDGSGTEPHRGFYFHRGEDTSSVVSGFTINGGYVYGGGAGIRCDSGSSPRLENLVLTDNLAHNSDGAGIACDGSNPIVRGCHIIDNFARNGDCCASGGGLALYRSNPVIQNTTILQNTAGWGGGIYAWLSWPEITSCTIADNHATGGWMTGPGTGGGLHLEADSRPTIVKTIIATNRAEIDGAIFRDQNSWAIMTCCDMYLNEGGDWTGDWEYTGTTDGNFSEKPRFCDTAIGDYHISNASYCVPERSGCGELVGALGVGCEVYDGPVWHVAVTGDDSTGNGSSELPFATIQQAVDWAFPGDTIIVHDGTYVGDGNRDINFGGKNLMLRSENGPEVTVIDCEGSSEEPHRAFSFTNGEDSSGVVQGFTITGGWHAEGSAVLCDTSSPTLSGNIFIGDTTDGWSWVSQYLIFCRQSKSLIDGNIFQNTPSHVLKCDGSNVRILGNLFIGNLGRAVYCYYSSPLIVGNTIADNDLEGSGGAVYCYQSNPVIKNTIMWGNGNPQIYSGWGSYPLLVTYCAVEGGYEGEGNISVPPLFLSPSDGDYNVCSQSPCIDAGDPDMFDPDGTRSDIGFFFDDHPDCPIGLRTLLHVDTSGSDLTADGSEENPFGTVQQAVNFALDGDTILVARGVYVENVTFYGREILLTSNLLYSDDRTDIEETIIDADSSGAAVSFGHGESRNARLNGFSICNSYGGEAGIACLNGSSPTISGNVIRDNYGTSGGISCRDSSDALILNNIIADNTGVGSYGWFGIYFPGTGGIYCSASSPEIINNTIAYNHATYNDNAVGLYCLGGSCPSVINTIFWGNSGVEIHALDSSAPTVRYSDIDGGWDGENNLNEYPFFLAPSEQDYTLCTQSPCIDAGDPDVLGPDGTRSDIGVYFGEYADCPIGLRTLLYVSATGSDAAGDGSPENPYLTIQHAISFSLDNDTVVVMNGTFLERVDFVGRNILLASNYLFS
ncbi:MAG: right-handed parallel beta-helix repeat-containing protein, partial [Candidatus Zixiibacteriota bacterium]